MKDTEVKRLLYQDSEAFKAGIEVGKKEVIDRACEWLNKYADDFAVPESETGRVYVDDLVSEFREAMEE